MARLPHRFFAAPLLLALVVAAAAVPHARQVAVGEREREAAGAEPDPSEAFYRQRVMPDGTFPFAPMEAARTQLQLMRDSRASVSGTSLAWQNVGPFNIGGRVTALAVTPGAGTAYLGAADGGVWKSVNGGINWACVTDRQTFASIGALALDPGDPNTLWCGTGEANGSVDSYDGNGLWRSGDGGQTWLPAGLATVGRIGQVAIDPTNPNRVLVAAMGRQFSTGPDRGVYRTEDGGQSWTKVLFVSDSTGAGDIVINPLHPDTMLCATWERVRRTSYRRAYGPECGIWRSVDRGVTWTRMTAGLPAPSDSVGRIALAISPSRPSTIYAQIGSGVNLGYVGLGYYRSTDGGTTWQKRDVGSTFSGNFGGFCWYFGRTAVDPQNADRVYALGVNLLSSNDGGTTWAFAGSALHPDQHAIWIDPARSTHLLVGDDGGFYSTTDLVGWNKSDDLPISQFYDGTVDPTNVNKLFGGLQDNNTVMTSSGPANWSAIQVGDGFYSLVDPVTPQVVFTEYQFCSNRTGFKRSTSGGPGGAGTNGWTLSDRFNWNTPITINPRNHNLLLAGSQFVYRSTDNGVNWTKISADLSTNPVSSLGLGTITTLDISSADTSVYYAGTDDGKVWRSLNRGTLWTDISAGLPGRWVTRVAADPVNPLVVYVTLSGFTSDDQSALVYRSPDRGTTWTNRSSNLPNVPANDLVVDPANSQVLYLASDAGVWISRDAGGSWFDLGVGMPLQSVLDLNLHAATRQLFAFTHGRSAWKLDLTAVPVSSPPAAPPAALALTLPRPNPTRGTVRFTLETAHDGHAEVSIYDVFGRRVVNLLEGSLGAGTHELAWDGRGWDGRRARAGVYFARAFAGGETRVQRIVVAD